MQSSFNFIDKETSFYATPLVSQKQMEGMENGRTIGNIHSM